MFGCKFKKKLYSLSWHNVLFITHYSKLFSPGFLVQLVENLCISNILHIFVKCIIYLRLAIELWGPDRKLPHRPHGGWAKSPFCVIPLRPCLLQRVVGCRDSPNSLHPLRALSFGLTKIWRGLSGFNKKKKSKRKGGCKSQKAEGREKRKRWQKGGGAWRTAALPPWLQQNRFHFDKWEKANSRKKNQRKRIADGKLNAACTWLQMRGIHGLIYAVYSKWCAGYIDAGINYCRA